MSLLKFKAVTARAFELTMVPLMNTILKLAFRVSVGVLAEPRDTYFVDVNRTS